LGLTKIIDDAYLVPLGTANAMLLDGVSEFALVDAGLSGKVSVVFDAIRQMIFTHHHPDHIGGAAAIVRDTGVATYMHPIDAPIAKTGGPMHPAPGLMERLAYRVIWHQHEMMEPVRIDRQIPEGDTLPIAGGLQVIHTTGHCAGQLAFLCQGERMLMAGDIGSADAPRRTSRTGRGVQPGRN
jgi:glyoxylase-like metal-dependent hydrolase (beta-lactamase superfamily II)